MQNFTGVNRGAEKTVIRFYYEIQLGMQCVRVMKFLADKCLYIQMLYLLTKQVQIGKKEKERKRSMRNSINIYLLKCSFVLVAGYLITQS